MSSAKDHDQDQPETGLREDGKANTSEEPQEQHTKVPVEGKHLLQPRQRKTRSVSPLSLIKEDFSQWKEEVRKVFTEGRSDPGSQAENNLISTTIDLLKEDLNHFKEDLASVFNNNSPEDKEAKPTEKSMKRLSSFKHDLSNIFRISQSKDRDTAKEDSSEAEKFKVSIAEWSKEAFVIPLRRDQTSSQKANNSQGPKETTSETSKDQTDDGFSENLSEQIEENINTTRKQQMEEREEAEADERAADMSLSEKPSEGEDLTPPAGRQCL